eukprot:5306900-Amphidinium_carterae.1
MWSMTSPMQSRNVVECMVKAGNLVKSEVARLRLTLSTDKSTVIASIGSLAHNIAGGIAGSPFQVARIHTSLGTSLTTQRCRSTALPQSTPPLSATPQAPQGQ